MERILRRKAVTAMTGLSFSSFNRYELAGKFPKRVKLGGYSVGWLESEIQQWIKEKQAARDAAAAK